jgi:hypothetical protein
VISRAQPRRAVGQRDCHLLELGQVLRNGIAEAGAPFFDQHHGGDSGDWLGHRVDAEERALGHRRAGLPILHADGLEVFDLSGARDGGNRAGDFLFLDVALEKRRRILERG